MIDRVKDNRYVIASSFGSDGPDFYEEIITVDWTEQVQFYKF